MHARPGENRYRLERSSATHQRYAKGSNVVVIDPDLQPLFPTSKAVNDALRALASIAKRAGGQKYKQRSA